MKSIWLLLILITFGFFQKKTSVEVYRFERDEVIEVHAKNNNIYPVTIELSLELKNLESDKQLPYIGFLPPHNNQKLMELRFTDKKAGWDYNSKYRFYMGNIFAQHNDGFAYRLPYRNGDSYMVAQGFGGAFSHQGELKHALDFNLPMGTEIYAARSGKVVMLEKEHAKGGPSEEMMEYANYVTILHDDGTFADYTHLQHNGVTVELGQQVRMGQVIGYSGATGYATGPHLHFVVKKTKKGGGFISIPVKFTTRDGIMELREGEHYIGY